MKNLFSNWPIRSIDIEDKDYPASLKEIKKSPVKIYYRGCFDKNMFEKCVAVVGSRKNTKYGQSVVESIVPKLVNEKITIVSGFMFGIDSLSHTSCIEYGGKTIAVLGNGLNIIYPSSNDKLYKQILDSGGLIMSEYEADFKPVLWSFPQRNRIVAGLANLGILVVEAGEKSGSLITARIGMEERRKIYCIPGPINSNVSVGTNQLIKEGLAKMVLSAEDILNCHNSKQKQMNLFDQLSGLEKNVVDLLGRESMTADELARNLKMEISGLLTQLSMMEMQGIIEEESGKYYITN